MSGKTVHAQAARLQGERDNGGLSGLVAGSRQPEWLAGKIKMQSAKALVVARLNMRRAEIIALQHGADWSGVKHRVFDGIRRRRRDWIVGNGFGLRRGHEP